MRPRVAARAAWWYVSRALGRRTVSRTVHGHRMTLALDDPGVSRALWLHGTREPLETSIVRREVRPGMIVVDLGANLGYYTLLMANLVGSDGYVYAIEPNEESVALLGDNMVGNDYGALVEIHCCAIADRRGSAVMHLGPTRNLHSLVPAWPSRSQPEIEVDILTLDECLAGRSIDFLRMDVEGGECEVFDGMTETIARNHPTILVEMHPDGPVDPDPRYTPRLERLLAAGYHAKWAISSFHPSSLGAYRALGYTPETIAPNGQALFADIKGEHLLAVAARRPKITRALCLSA